MQVNKNPELPISVRFANFGIMLAAATADEMSKDPSTKVGACLMTEDLAGTFCSWNGFPRGIADDERMNDREQKYPRTAHAELNAIINSKGACNRGHLFVTFAPCSQCAVAICQAGIQAVYFSSNPGERSNERWISSQTTAIDIFLEKGIRVFRQNRATKLWSELLPSQSGASTTASSGSLTSWATTLPSWKVLASLTAKALRRSARTRG